MPNYLYSVDLASSSAKASGFPESNGTDVSDFETNHKSSAVAVTRVLLTDTTIVTEKTYTDFESLITGDIDWGDVVYTSRHGIYGLCLLSGSPL